MTINHCRILMDFASRLRMQILADSPIPEPSFERLALELFQAQFALNPPYRRIAEARGARPETVHSWLDIPAVPTSAFKELELSCLAPVERSSVFHSSGTTGHLPSRHFHHRESLALYEASSLSWFTKNVPYHDPNSNDRRSALARPVILTPPPLQVPHSSLARMFEFARLDLGAPASAFVGTLAPDGAWTLDFRTATAALRSAHESGTPLLLLGTAFSFVHLLDHFAAHDLSFRLASGSRAMETGGYKGRSRALPQAALHALMTRRLGLPSACIVREYGMSELSSQAYDHAGGGVFHFPPWARARVISPETGAEVAEGHTGLLRLYDLANAFSVLAIQTEDLAVRRGAGFELIGRAEAAEPRGCSLAAA